MWGREMVGERGRVMEGRKRGKKEKGRGKGKGKGRKGRKARQGKWREEFALARSIVVAADAAWSRFVGSVRFGNG
jgi:hypothetical protein